jgi:hypothetical protein
MAGRLYGKFCRKRAVDLLAAARDYLPPSDTRCGSRVYAPGCLHRVQNAAKLASVCCRQPGDAST